jgi:4-hydroxy-2-oxoglutarate aldolase
MTVPPFGIYPPLVCFFNDDESINYTAIAQHVERQINSGVTGLVIHGSNGEAAHLLHDERSEIIRLARRIIDKSSNINNKSATIIAGCSAPSIRETLQLITEAKKAGANYALVLPPSYYSSAMTKPVIKSYFTTVSFQFLSLSIYIYIYQQAPSLLGM